MAACWLARFPAPRLIAVAVIIGTMKFTLRYVYTCTNIYSTRLGEYAWSLAAATSTTGGCLRTMLIVRRRATVVQHLYARVRRRFCVHINKAAHAVSACTLCVDCRGTAIRRLPCDDVKSARHLHSRYRRHPQLPR